MPRLGTGKKSGLIPYCDAESANNKGGAMDYLEIRNELYGDGDPLIKFAESILYPAWKRCYRASKHESDCVTVRQELDLERAWATVLRHESEIRPILKDCKEMIG